MQPPRQLDGADVVLWSWAAPEPFFEMPVTGGHPSIPIHGLAIARYADGEVYLFTCDAGWEVMNDSPQASVEGARTASLHRVDTAAVDWIPWEGDT